MMREIKFRAWDGKRLYTKVLIGNVSDPASEDYTAHCVYRDGDWFHSDEHDSIVFEQYTGLKDKNGVEIYEGDIIASWDVKDGFDSYIANVYFNDDSAVYQTSEVNGGVENLCEYNFECEVIGNIHQNPELVEAP